MINKSDVSGFINKTDLNEKIQTLATKSELKIEQDKIIKLKIPALSNFLNKKLFWLLWFLKYVCLSTNI